MDREAWRVSAADQRGREDVREMGDWIAGPWSHVLKYAAIMAAGGFASRIVMVTGWTVFSGFLMALVVSYLVLNVGKDLTLLHWHRREDARQADETGQEGDVGS